MNLPIPHADECILVGGESRAFVPIRSVVGTARGIHFPYEFRIRHEKCIGPDAGKPSCRSV